VGGPSSSNRAESVRNADWALAQPRIRVAPSLLAADFSRLADEVTRIEKAGVEMIHLDVMDGHFVPNISFGVPVIEAIRPLSRLFFDAHLMISEPLKYAEPFAKAGCDLITFHIETMTDPLPIIDRLESLGVRIGVSLNPTTEASAIEPIIEKVDLVLVMSVWPGFGGQKFITDVLPKVSQLREMMAPHQRLEIDGGIDEDTIGQAVWAGADTLVAGSAIFRRPDPVAAYEALRAKAAGAS